VSQPVHNEKDVRRHAAVPHICINFPSNSKKLSRAVASDLVAYRRRANLSASNQLSPW
jgi:hypothetical protein